jgi:hypothetical protein
MKIIINESQLRLIVENKQSLYIVSDEVLDNLGFDSIMKLYRRSGKSGIKFVGDLNILERTSNYRLDTKNLEMKKKWDVLMSSAEEFFNELVIVTGVLDITDQRFKSFPNIIRLGALDGANSSGVVNFPSLVKIDNWCTMQYSYEINFPELVEVGAELVLHKTGIKELPKLVRAGFLNLNECKNITILPELVEIIYTSNYNEDSFEPNLRLTRSSVSRLPKLTRVDGEFELFSNKNIYGLDQFPSLEYVGGEMDLRNTPLSDFITKESIKSKITVEGEIYL